MSAADAGLWSYLDGCPVRNQAGDLLHLLVGNGDATLGPVNFGVKAAYPGETLFNAVDHDVAAR